MSLNAEATSRCSVDPSTRARASSSPPATRRAVRAKPRRGLASEPARSHATPRPSKSATRPTATSAITSVRTSPCTASTLCVTRTAPAGRLARTTGTAVKRRSSPSESLCRVPCEGRPVSARAISGLVAYEVDRSPAPAESTSRRPFWSTTITRPPRRSEASRTSSSSWSGSSRRPAAPAASSCACPWASLLISASTRRDRLSASGTKSATITSTST
jgi:hypothetical protein